jgi:hypothetical protein
MALFKMAEGLLGLIDFGTALKTNKKAEKASKNCS